MSSESVEQPDPKKLEAALNELRVINRVLDKICRARETNHIMSIIVDELVAYTQADQGVIHLLTPGTSDDFVTVVRRSPNGPEEIPFTLNNLICGWVLKNKQTLKIDDLTSDDRFPGLSSKDGRFSSILCCPLIVRGEVIGITSLIRGSVKGPFHEDHGRLAGIIASQSAQILSNARLLEELARKTELLEFSQKKLHDENIRLRQEIGATYAFENIVGKSEPMKRVLTLASKVSGNDAPVLITGPTGTGKELLAGAIHQRSNRRGKPYVIKNCGVKTESLLESELFGHVKGSFTGADRDKPGLFRAADGGTVFLDEIGDAPLSTQAAILRVLETGEYRPVGATKSEFVDVRIISATNRDLKELIQKGQFRQDLYYRLNTFTIDIPPLCHRREDIPILVHHILRKLKVKLQMDNLSISPRALEVLCNYSWPGNVRQLENELERAAIVCDTDGIIEISDLSPDVRGLGVSEPEVREYRGPLKELIEKVERDTIEACLAETRGNILKSSRLLGLTRKGLKDKIARYGIEIER